MKRLATGFGMLAMAAASSSAMAGATFFDNEGDLLANTQSGYYQENFDSFSAGPQGASLDFGPENGFSYTISAANDLYSGDGVMSTNTADDPLEIDFTGDNVTAVGGNFYGTDISFVPIAGDVTVELADGTSETMSTSSADAYFGFITDAPIDSMTISASGDGNVWPTMDNFTVGQAVPAPGALALLGLAGVAGRRRRRQ